MINVPKLVLLLVGCVAVIQGFTGGVPRASILRLKNVSLQMGLGSFVKKRMGRDGDEDDAKKKKASPPPKRPVAPQPVRPHAQQPAPPLQREPDAPPRRSLPGPESTQDRIMRVKQGKLTDEEKQRFLATTLKGGMEPTISRGGDSVVRQPLPDITKVVPRNVKSATPFPRDSMLKEVVTGRKDHKAHDEWRDNNKKKKEYFDMVTDPNRFTKLKAGIAPTPSQPRTSLLPVSSSRGIPPPHTRGDSDILDAQIPWDSIDPLSAAPQAPEPNPVASDNTTADANHLGARLEAAAMAEEKRQREARAHVEKHREEERSRQYELQRARDAEMIEREQEYARQKRESDEKTLVKAQAQAVQDKSRQQNMMKAQEDYWSKKLAGERQRKLQKLSEEDQAKEERRVTEEARLKAAVKRQEDEAARQILRNEQEDLDAEIPAESYVAPSPPASWDNPAPVSSQFNTGNPFVDEQARKLADIERRREEQLEKLKALSSPLPTGPSRDDSPYRTRPLPPGYSQEGYSMPTHPPPPYLSSPPPPAYSQPATPAPTYQPPAPPPAYSQPANPAPAPPPAFSRPAYSQKANPAPAPLSRGPAPPPAFSRPAYSQPAAPAPRGLSELQKLVNPNRRRANVDDTPVASPGRSIADARGFSRPPAPAPVFEPEDDYSYEDDYTPEPPVAQPRKIFRQELPPLDDEDEEFEAFARGGPNQGMSIGDALKTVGEDGDGGGADQSERSKMWGIDMTRFD